MSEKRGRGQPKFEPTQDQRSQVKLMKALGIPEDRICKTITNPRTRKPVAPMTLARAFAAELASGATEVHALVGNFILCAILGKKPVLGDAIKSEQVRMTLSAHLPCCGRLKVSNSSKAPFETSPGKTAILTGAVFRHRPRYRHGACRGGRQCGHGRHPER